MSDLFENVELQMQEDAKEKNPRSAILASQMETEKRFGNFIDKNFNRVSIIEKEIKEVTDKYSYKYDVDPQMVYEETVSYLTKNAIAFDTVEEDEVGILPGIRESLELMVENGFGELAQQWEDRVASMSVEEQVGIYPEVVDSFVEAVESSPQTEMWDMDPNQYEDWDKSSSLQEGYYYDAPSQEQLMQRIKRLEQELASLKDDDGAKLLSNASHLRGSAIWIKFPRVICQNWIHWDEVQGKRYPTILLGDSAHTAHFSIGSGTKLAMEDAIELARAFESVDKGQASIESALASYQDTRSIEVLKIQSAARNAMEWFENVKRYAHMEPEQFNYSLLTRSQRIGHENLRLRDKKYLEEYERYKDIQIIEGREYLVLNRPSTTYQVVQVDYIDEKVSLSNKSGIFLTKTLHWCRKNLSMLGDKT